MKIKSLITILALGLPGLATAQAVSHQCSFGDLQRRVEIFTEPGVSVPCEVHYYKDTEAPGERQVLWSATSEEGYCERKTDEFLTKLEGWGWDCGRGTAEEESAEAAPEAETEAEAPAEPEADTEAMDDTEALDAAE